jgi:hypothetical protein
MAIMLPRLLVLVAAHRLTPTVLRVEACKQAAAEDAAAQKAVDPAALPALLASAGGALVTAVDR